MSFVREILSGISVSLTLVPTSIAYALFLGMSPMVGLYASIVMVLSTAFLGSQPGIVSNATAAVAVAMLGLVQKMGPEYLYLGVIVGGILQMLFVFFKMEALFTYIPETVVSGFLLGLAGLIAKGQIAYFKSESYFNKDGKAASDTQVLEEEIQKHGWMDVSLKDLVHEHKSALLKKIGINDDREWLTKDKLLITLLITFLGIIIMFATHFGVNPIPGSVPGALINVGIITILYYLSPASWGLRKASTIGDMGSVGGKFLSLRMPNVPINLKSILTVLPYSISMALSTLTESMLMMKKATKIMGKPGDSRQENIAMGIGNIISGFTGGMGGNVCVGLSQLNLANGARTRWSTFTAGIVLIAIMLFLSKWVEGIPMPALIAIMVFIVFETGDWKAFVNNKKMKDRIVIAITALSAFLSSNLAVGVVSGTLVHHASKGIFVKC